MSRPWLSAIFKPMTRSFVWIDDHRAARIRSDCLHLNKQKQGDINCSRLRDSRTLKKISTTKQMDEWLGLFRGLFILRANKLSREHHLLKRNWLNSSIKIQSQNSVPRTIENTYTCIWMQNLTLACEIPGSNQRSLMRSDETNLALGCILITIGRDNQRGSNSLNSNN